MSWSSSPRFTRPFRRGRDRHGRVEPQFGDSQPPIAPAAESAAVPRVTLPRRYFLSATGGGVAAVIAARPASVAALSPHHDATGSPRPAVGVRISCHGDHQAGIVTPAPTHLLLAGFDLTVTHRRDVVELLRTWQSAIERLTAGSSLGDGNSLSSPPVDTGEALGQGPARLTLTIGFGPSLFDARFGLAERRPAALVDLPAFAGEALDPAVGGGDLSVQACADRQVVVEHALRDLARQGAGAVRVRWTRSGFNEAPVLPSGGTPRNLLGFKDGTANLDAGDADRMRRNVWVARTDGPNWMVGGTYQVYRRVALRIEDWDASILDEQQDTFGRYKVSGAPYGGHDEFDPVNVAMQPTDSHVRLANPRTGQASEDERILRRGYNFSDGVDPATGKQQAGLAFIAYQRDPRRQFVTIQQRLAANDALNEYAVHTASGIFAVPPGVRGTDFVGSRLFA